MNELKDLIIFLSQFDISNAKCHQIIEKLGDNPSIAKFRKAKLDKEGLLTSVNYKKMLDSADEKLVMGYKFNLADRGIKITTKFEDDYPKKLFDLDDAPIILYYMGDISLANAPSLAVVGTRKPTNYGRMVTERLVKDVASAGVVIVSGLAYGVDSIAHKKCLDVGGKTIAVLGGGFDHVYPAEHQSLAMEIAKKGLLLSEYRPKKTATKYTFPLRNRIVAGLSDGVLITEAGLKSGTIHTRDYALDYGRNLYAVPGNIDSESSTLTNDILKRGHGAMVTCSDDILRDYSIEKTKFVQQNFFDNLSEDEQKIVENLKNGMKSIEELTKLSKLSINIFNTCLTTLEISGIISRMPGGYIALS